MSTTYWNIGKIAKRSGVTVSALHFYETKGLIQSIRNSGNQRQYKKEVLRRIALIKAAQKLGITLEEIKQTLATLPNNRTPNQKDWELLAEQWQTQLDKRIAYMTKLRDSLTGCIGCGCLSMDNCPIYNAEDKMAKSGAGAIILNNKKA